MARCQWKVSKEPRSGTRSHRSGHFGPYLMRAPREIVVSSRRTKEIAHLMGVPLAHYNLIHSYSQHILHIYAHTHAYKKIYIHTHVRRCMKIAKVYV